MDIIQLLPDSVANQIAAGEVIQRPASVIKELVENAIDAGARDIQVLVCDAGKSSIQVIDNGCGMSDTDARLSFERHATSKIRQAVDLFSLHTMGFRGEALASIAAVAQVTLQTRTADDELGTRLVISGSRFVEQEVVNCPVGSNFLIENLFFNIPARRKFLKSNATEMSNITDAFIRIALVYPEVSFTLYNNGMETLQLRAGTTRQRILDVFGKRINQQLLPVDTDTTICKVMGFVGKPEAAKKKGAQQFFFVNGRYMKHPYFHKAVLSAYDRLIPDGTQVPYFLYFTVNPEDIDVNIHPVKTEIKFENEQAIWQILMAAVRDAVGKFSEVTTLDFDTLGKPEIPVFNPSGSAIPQAPQVAIDATYNPFADSDNEIQENFAKSPKIPSPRYNPAPAHHDYGGKRSAKGWEELFGDADAAKPSAVEQPLPLSGVDNMIPSALFGEETEDVAQPYLDRSAEHYQYQGRFIVTQIHNGMMFIDQHRAHMRILYEQYMKTLETRTAHTQKVLFPDTVQFPPSYSTCLDTIMEELEALGFEMTCLGGGSYQILGVPAGLGGLDPVSLVNDLVSEAYEQGCTATERVNDILAQGLARKAATPLGEVLDNEAMENMVAQLLRCKSQRYTPDGKIIISVIENEEIMRRFD